MSGTKHDINKIPMTLTPRALTEGVAKVMAFGASKYGRDNYKQGFKYTRILDAALRHITAYADGEDKDPESGLSHLEHAAASIGMLLECQRLGTAEDDRYATTKTK